MADESFNLDAGGLDRETERQIDNRQTNNYK